MNVPKVSIVIPTYNAAEFVADTIDCVLLLVYPPGALELIVVDDGSIDGTVNEVRRRLRDCPFFWRLIEQPNAGPSTARNTGWRAARGEWIQFLDADDLVASQKLIVQVDAVQPAPREVAVIYSPWQQFDLHEGVCRLLDDLCVPVIGNDPILDILKSKNFMQLGSLMIRRHWLDAVEGFNETRRYIEDVDLVLRLAMAGGEFVYVQAEQALFLYRQREGSLSRQSRRGFIDGCISNAFLAEKFWKESGTPLTESQRQVLSNYYGNSLPFYFEEDRREFRRLLAHVLELDPNYRRGGRAMDVFTRLLGHEAAESVAAIYRRIRHRSGIRDR